MAFGIPYLFYLTDPDTGEYYYVDDNGNVDTQVDPIPLNHAPDKWRETEIKLSRSRMYWGVFRNFSTPYEFVLDGRKIIKSIDDARGVNGACRLLIKQLVSTDGSYVNYYSGDLDFSKCRINRTRAIINIMEGGLVDTITNNSDTTYEYILDPATGAITLTMDGVTLQGSQHYVGTSYGDSISSTDAPIPFPLTYVSQDGEYPIGVGATVIPDPTIAGYQNHVLFTSSRDQDIDFHLQSEISYTNTALSFDPGIPTVQILIASDVEQAAANNWLNPGIASIFWEAGTPLNPGDSASYNIDQHFNYTLAPGNVVFLGVYIRYPVVTGAEEAIILISDGAVFDISSTFLTDNTEVLTSTIADVWGNVVDLATDGEYVGESAYLSDDTAQPEDAFGNVPYSTLVASGDAIRGVADAKIKTTVNDVFKTAFDIWNCGMVLDIPNGKALLKPLTEILDKTTEIVDLGAVSDLEIEHADDLMGNVINEGYQSQNSKALNGRYEFNSTSQWKLPIKTVKKAFDWVSPYFGGMYAIEEIRNNVARKSTTDNSTDNDIYLIESVLNVVDSTATLQRLQNEPGNFVAGLPIYVWDTAYNLGLTPARNLLRKGDLVCSICDLQDTEAIFFQTTDKFSGLSSALFAGDNVAESATINVSALPDKLFKPIYFKFTSRIPVDLLSLANATPYGYISFSYLGVPLKGFPMDIGIYPATNGAYDVVLLCHPEVDTTTIP